MGFGARIGATQIGSVDLSVDPLRNRFTSQSIVARQSPNAAVTAGIRGGPFSVGDVLRATVGVAFQEALSLPMAFVANVALEGLDSSVTFPIAVVANYAPRTFSAGLGLLVLQRVELEAEVQYAVWSAAPTPYMAVQTIISGRGASSLGLVGALDAPGPGQSRIAPAGFKDTLQLRVGAETSFWDERLRVRGGYSYRPSPVPDQTSGTNLADATAHIVAFGAGYILSLDAILPRPVQLDVAWQSQVFEPRRADKERQEDPTGSWVFKGSVGELSVGATYVF
jgi:long-subunit fatty acid transport protein